MTDRETIERRGQRFVLVPESNYQEMMDALDELAAIVAYDRVKAKDDELIPGEVADRLLEGENAIRVFRQHRGMTQQALAEAVGISTPYLSQLESGIRQPSLASLLALAEALRVDLELLAPPKAYSPQRKTGRRATHT